MSIITSELMQQRAEEAYRSGNPLRESESYEVFALPAGFMDHLVLFLWRAGSNHTNPFPEGDITLPVTIDGRAGYLMSKTTAAKFQEV